MQIEFAFVVAGGDGEVQHLRHCHRRMRRADFHAAAVQLEQSTPAVRVGQRNLDRLIDSSRTRSESRFEEIRAIRREDEQNVRIVCEAVHLVQ